MRNFEVLVVSFFLVFMSTVSKRMMENETEFLDISIRVKDSADCKNKALILYIICRSFGVESSSLIGRRRNDGRRTFGRLHRPGKLGKICNFALAPMRFFIASRKIRAATSAPTYFRDNALFTHSGVIATRLPCVSKARHE